MKLKNCEYCGTEYNAELRQCPLCGRSANAVQEGKPSAKRGGARVAPRGTATSHRKEDRIPQWMWGVTCVILGFAVLVGLAYFLFSMGYLGGKKSQPIEQPSIAVVPEVDPVNEPELMEPMPEQIVAEEPEPVDLSCTDLLLSQSGIVFDVVGSTVFLTAVPTPVDCPDPIIFQSADETVATVAENGMIMAVGPGQTEIYATCGTVTNYCLVVCDFPAEEETEQTDPEEDPNAGAETEEEQETEPEEETEEVLKPELSSEDFTLFRPGEQTTLKVKNAPAGAYITFASSNTDVVTVDANGKVTAIGNGVSNITVMVDDVKLTCIARCNLGTTAENTEDGQTTLVGNLSLSHTDAMLFSVGEAFTIGLFDENGNKVTGVSWSTGNGAVCSVDANGRVTAIGNGTTTVTGIYKGKSYECIIRCNF